MLSAVRDGDVFLLRSHGFWYSDAIAWFMKSEWSHCGVVLFESDSEGEPTLTLETSDYEMTYGGLEKYLKHPDRYRLKVLRVPNAFVSVAEMRVALCVTDELYYGKMYGYLQLLSFAVVRLFKRIGIKVPNFIRQGQVCTAGPLHYLGQGLHPVFKGVDPEALDTQDFAEMLVAAGAKTIFESGPGSGNLEPKDHA